MRFSVPILIESTKPATGSGTLFVARPLFHATPIARNENLSRLTAKLARDLGKELEQLGRLPRQDLLARYSFNPRLVQQRHDIRIELRKRVVKARFLFLLFRQLRRRVAFTPGLPDLWFDLQRGEKLPERATAVLTQYFRAHESDDDEVRPEDFALSGTAWVQNLELDVQPAVLFKPPEVSRFLMLGGDSGEKMDGAEELRRVGRCLDWLYPDELDTVLLRDGEADELQRLLDADDRRPVLLVGPRMVGKTALLHEYVRRTVAQRATPFHNHGNTWLLAPARLISGMSYVGQWENRLLAIVKESRRREHLLYFDDLIGLFRAGQTSQSTLSAAQVLKPYLERRDIRVVAEITPEAFRVLREKDRSLADLFHIFPVSELSDDKTLRVLIGVQRQLEQRERCRFDLEVLPAVLDLQRRYVRDRVFPGKGATFLQQLAVQRRRSSVSRHAVLEEFRARSGLAVAFLDTNRKLERPRILEDLEKLVVGQEAALQAAADVVSIAKARLNDPDRPLASLLFLGPTGVGKTQAAKALAQYLFGDPQRLLRFDMNEFLADGSAARLVGTFDRPEGLLTAAVRRQPFAVVLFDEIEKAHPEVFDLLLAVLGEGRLTDSLGRTVDYTNTIIILTSNLGVREAEAQIGFGGAGSEARDAAFIRAAERFFRPEFFNRLDRVIPFQRLQREQVRKIAEMLIQEVFQREGLVQRKCVLHIDGRALEHVVDRGFDPHLGARALKRAIERQLTQPVSAQLAALAPDTFTIINVLPRAGELAVQVIGLEQVKPLAPVQRPAITTERLQALVSRIEAELEPLRPRGAISAANLTADQYRYFAVREQLDELRELVRKFDEEQHERRPAISKPAYVHGDRAGQGRFKIITNRTNPTAAHSALLREMAAALNIEEYFRDLCASAVPAGEVGDDLPQRLTLLHWQSRPGPPMDRALVVIRCLDTARGGWAHWFGNFYIRALGNGLGIDTNFVAVGNEVLFRQGYFLAARGANLGCVLENEIGTHLVCPAHGQIVPLLVRLVPLADGADARDAAESWHDRRAAWLAELERGESSFDADPAAPGPVVRVYQTGAGPICALDLRTGMIDPGFNVDSLRAMILAGLPLPPELSAAIPPAPSA